MKRNISFLFFLLLGIVVAFAEDISSLSEISATQSYYIRQGSKGYLYAKDGKACTDARTVATADESHKWGVVYSETLGAYFLYNLSDSTFLSTAEGVCPLVEAATPIFLSPAAEPATWYAYTSGGVIGLSGSSSGSILVQGESASQPDALSFEVAGTLSDDHQIKIQSAVWLTVTQQTNVPIISNIGTRISSISDITDGASFLLYSTGMSKYAFDTGDALSFNASAPAKNNITAMPYVFTFHKIGDTYTIETGVTGNFISGLSGSTVATGEVPITFTITASSTAGSFNLYNAASSQYINAQSAKPVGWSSSEGNSRYQLIPVTLANSDKYFPVTYICYETDGQYSRLMDVQTYAKSTNRLSAPTFSGYKRLSMKAADGITSATSAVTAPTVVYVYYERSLRSQPVVPTTIAENAFADTTRWYTINVDGRYMRYAADAPSHYYLSSSELSSITDNDLWCFVGNNVEGYRVYNRSAGTARSLALKDEPISTDLPFIQEGEFPFWAISNGGTTGTWYMSPVGAKNTVYLADDGQRKLSVMSTAAPVVITEAAVTMQDFAAEVSANIGTNVGQYVGGSVETLVVAAEDYSLTNTAFNNLQTSYNQFCSDTERVTIERNQLYRIVSPDGSVVFSAPVDATTLSAKTAATSDRSQLWRILPVGNIGTYYVLNPENGKFLGVASGTRDITMLDEPATHSYSITNPTDTHSAWLLRDGGTTGSNNYINLTEEGVLTGGRNTAETASWIIEPVKQFVIETQGTGAFAATTIYLPFSVALPSNLTAAAITEKGEASVTIETLPDGVVPAFTPALIISDEPGEYVLSQMENNTEETPEANLLVGVEKRTTAESNAAFVLGEEAAFVLSDGTLKAYTAYLDRETTEAATLAIALPTAIEQISIGNASDVIGKWYDIQGRPVNTPSRPGIFIYKGRKVVVTQ